MKKKTFEPTWESLKQYEAPEWFRNAKFGLWAHWGPQCQPEQGDWYGRLMYDEGSRHYKWHIDHYGHPSEVGFKDVIHDWKAEKWDPEALVKFYKRCGARYFFAMANHHDNFDLWDSKYQPWNSVNMGPKRDILDGWRRAAINNDLPFGISVHAAHAWLWYETARRSDKNGPLAGIAYDGILSREDGKGTWWEGYDPQDLYAQNHPLSENSHVTSSISKQWGWKNGAAAPSDEYCTKFYNRMIDMIDRYTPDLIYFDDAALPLWPASDVGLRIAAYYYNHSMMKHYGSIEAAIFGKILTEEQKECLLWDVEKGTPDRIEIHPWQTCTCIGGWHYEKRLGDSGNYKSAGQVIRTLGDVVSKNGNLLLSIPVRGDGTIDKHEIRILEEIAGWMDVNREAIFDTRPWHTFGEGPALKKAEPLQGVGFNEGIIREFSSRDIRFTRKKDVIYTIAMAWPEDGKITIHSLASDASGRDDAVADVELLGGPSLNYNRDAEGLKVTLPERKASDMPLVLKLYTK